MQNQISNELDPQKYIFSDNNKTNIINPNQIIDKIVEEKNDESLIQLIENIGMAFWKREIETNKIEYVSPTFANIWHKPLELFIENPSIWLEWIHPEDKKFINEKLNNQIHNKEFIFRCFDYDNKIRWIRAFVRIIKDQTDGKQKLVGICEDITSAKETEMYRISLTEKLNFLIKKSPTVIYTTIPEKNFETNYISENVSSVLGFNAEVLMDKDFWRSRIHPDDFKVVNKMFFSLNHEKRVYAETRFRHSDGNYRWLYNELFWVNENNVIGYFTDITKRKDAELCLEKANEQITNIFSNLDEAYFSFDGEGKGLVMISQACEKIYGYNEVDFINDPLLWYKVIYPEDKALVDLMFSQVGKVAFLKFESRIFRPDGEIRWLSNRIKPLFNPDGELYRLDGIVSDITERKQAEKKLYDSESLFRTSFEHASIGMALIDITGKFLRVNNSFCSMIGYSEEELLSQSFSKITHHEDKDLSFNNLNQLFFGKIDSLQFEKRYIHKSGFILWAKLNTTLIRDNCGSPLYYITHIEDITEKKYSDDKLREQAELLDIIDEAIVVIDPCGKIIFWNNRAEKLYGQTKEDVLGIHLKNILYKNNFKNYDIAFKTVFKTGKWNGEINQLNAIGENIIVESKWKLLNVNKLNLKSIMIINTDITKKKQTEEESMRVQRLESIGILSSGIAHDLNNVLAPIMMSLEILGMDINTEKRKSILENLKKSALHGKELVKQVLTFSRGIENKIEKIFILEIVDEVVKIIRGLISKNVEIITNIPGDIWKIEGDKTQINQLIMNLIVNANDAIFQEGIIKISAENQIIDETYAMLYPNAKPGPFIILTFSDTGMGISPAVIDKIFEPFFTTKEIGKGTGLGLSTVIGIVKGHNGFITVNSKEGKGTEFKIYLPAVMEDGVKVMPEEEQFTLKGNGETLLLIDDEAVIREIAREVLEGNNYKVITACNGVEGITKFIQNKEKISLVITDIKMPVMDGNQTINALYLIDPDIKIIATSGIEQEERFSIKNNNLLFITKPYMINSLLQNINTLLK